MNAKSLIIKFLHVNREQMHVQQVRLLVQILLEF